MAKKQKLTKEQKEEIEKFEKKVLDLLWEWLKAGKTDDTKEKNDGKQAN